jgi:iron-sulfur cluster insertion protein
MTKATTIEITESAFKRALELGRSNDEILRISVSGGGCSGFTYHYEMTRDIMHDDTVFEKQGAKIVIDTVSQEYMQGSTVDFIENLSGRYFSIQNPKATSKCGCGKSFGI